MIPRLQTIQDLGIERADFYEAVESLQNVNAALHQNFKTIRDCANFKKHLAATQNGGHFFFTREPIAVSLPGDLNNTDEQERHSDI